MTSPLVAPAATPTPPESALWPTASTDASPRSRHRRLFAGVLVALAMIAVIATVVAMDGPGATAGLRTATVQHRTVTRTLDGVGVVEPVSQAKVAFPLSGTVASVDVQVGQQVAVGSTLATLATTSLQSSLDTAKAKAAQAALDLEQAQNGESSGSGRSGTNGAGSASGSDGATGVDTSGTAQGDDPQAATPLDTSNMPSAATLAAKQQTLDAANAAVTVAEQAFEQARIVSPITGKVVAVTLATGDTVSAASTTQSIVVAGTGGNEVTMFVPVAKIPDIHKGQTATVAPDGSSRTWSGEVVAIGLTEGSSSASTTYAVTVSLSGDSSSLRNGATASLSIQTSSHQQVTAVPTSAVTTTANRHTVTVVEDGKTRVVSVGVGTIGSEWTQITKGLTSGQLVVLADLSEPLPSSATDSSNRSGSRFAGFGATGFGGTGFESSRFSGGG